MKIAVLQFVLEIPHAESLKDKRRVVRSVKDKLHNEHLVAVAEVGHLDVHNLAMLGLTAVGTSVPHLQSLLDRIVDKLKALPDATLGAVDRQIISGEGGEDTDQDPPTDGHDEARTQEGTGAIGRTSSVLGWVGRVERPERREQR